MWVNDVAGGLPSSLLVVALRRSILCSLSVDGGRLGMCPYGRVLPRSGLPGIIQGAIETVEHAGQKGQSQSQVPHGLAWRHGSVTCCRKNDELVPLLEREPQLMVPN